MNRNIIPDKCICGNSAKIIGYYIKGVANHKNYFVKCNNCKTRTRSRKTPYKAVEEWNEYRGDLFLQQRKINVGVDMKEDIDIKWLEEYAEQEKKYKWGKEIKKLIKRNKELEEERDNLIIQKNADYYKISKLKDDLDEVEGDRDYNYIPKSKLRELQDKYKNKIKKIESKKIWNEPVDTINKNRYTNYFNAYEELLQEGDK